MPRFTSTTSWAQCQRELNDPRKCKKARNNHHSRVYNSEEGQERRELGLSITDFPSLLEPPFAELPASSTPASSSVPPTNNNPLPAAPSITNTSDSECSSESDSDAMDKPARKPNFTAKKRDAMGNVKEQNEDGSSEASSPMPKGQTAPTQQDHDIDDLTNPVILVHGGLAQNSQSALPQVKFTPQTEVKGIKFYSSDLTGKDNKIPQRYLYAQPDELYSKIKARVLDIAPFKAGYNIAERGLNMYFNSDLDVVTNSVGYQSVRANVCAREGDYYFETKIIHGMKGVSEYVRTHGTSEPGSAHVRVGWARREHDLDRPVGSTFYSYGIRDVGGEAFFNRVGSNSLETKMAFMEVDDVIGLRITLPPLTLHQKIVDGTFNKAVDLDVDSTTKDWTAKNIVRDRLVVSTAKSTMLHISDYRADPGVAYVGTNVVKDTGPDEYDIPVDPNHQLPVLRTLPMSSIQVYKNGKLVGTAFENLLAFLPPASAPPGDVYGVRQGMDDGNVGYFPTVSTTYGSAAEINCGPDFWFPPADLGKKNAHGQVLQAIGTRYDEQIAEDCFWDIVDEACLSCP